MKKTVSQYQHIPVVLVSLFLWAVVIRAQNAGELITAQHGMVVSASAEASRVGVEVLQAGGNAVDAAVAMGFALAVTYPSAGNLGGGAYLVIHMADGRKAAIDARETAPARATRDMYLDANGEVVEGLSLKGPLSSGVPGSVDGLLMALERFGTRTRQDVMIPAVQLARYGFPLHPRAANLFRIYRNEFEEFPSSMEVFARPDGTGFEANEVWKQPDLAQTLERILLQGRDGFYKGETAAMVVAQMQSDGGIITLSDLAEYTAIMREPIVGDYMGYQVHSMPPSSSGGVVLIEMLTMLQQLPFAEEVRGSVRAVHLMAEVMKRAFADRAVYLGDPAFTDIPLTTLVSARYATNLAEAISLEHATPADAIHPGINQLREGDNTTHYCVIDRWGNAVSVTTTLNSTFGSKCVVKGAGFLLNNEMDDFSAKPGVPNQFGLIGSEANAIAPGKRMLSSMTPVIITRDGAPVLITGSPGGSRIITTVLHVLLNVLHYRMPIHEAITAPRYHHQWRPDEIQYEENALAPDVIARLRSMGHALKQVADFGRAEGIVVGDGLRYGSSDPRGYGAAYGH